MESEMAPAPKGWEIRFSKTKNKYYYFNPQTKESQWELPQEEEQVQVLHILVKHKDSRNPSSWKEQTITRTKQQAIDILTIFKNQIKTRQDFERIAQVESDCSSAKRGGDLGPFGRGKMQKPFEDASFSLLVGEFSDIVSTDSGVHLIHRIA